MVVVVKAVDFLVCWNEPGRKGHAHTIELVPDLNSLGYNKSVNLLYRQPTCDLLDTSSGATSQQLVASTQMTRFPLSTTKAATSQPTPSELNQIPRSHFKRPSTKHTNAPSCLRPPTGRHIRTITITSPQNIVDNQCRHRKTHDHKPPQRQPKGKKITKTSGGHKKTTHAPRVRHNTRDTSPTGQLSFQDNVRQERRAPHTRLYE